MKHYLLYAGCCMCREMITGFAAAEVDKLVETKGLDVIDAGEL